MDMIDTQMAEKYIENQIVLSDEKTSSTFKRSAKITEIKMILSTFFSTKKTLTLANIIEAMRIESHAVSKKSYMILQTLNAL